jgi:hypothetical protein
LSQIFNNSLCGLEAVAAPAYPLIDDCKLLRAPLPIYECPGLDIPIDVPIEIPCPDLFAAASIVATPSSVGTGLQAAVHVTTTKSPSSLSCGTAIDFDFRFNIPLPPSCPQISAAAGTTYGVGVIPQANVTAIRNVGSRSHCQFVFDFDFRIPLPRKPICPAVSVFTTTTVLQSTLDPRAAVTVTRQSHGSLCGFEFDFDFRLPRAPAPVCPSITGAATLGFTYGSHTGIQLTTTRNTTGGRCATAFDFNLVLPIPPCPDLFAKSDLILLPDVAPSVNVTVTRARTGTTFSSITSTGRHVSKVVQVGNCDYVINFDFVLPSSLGGGGGSGPGGCICQVMQCISDAEAVIGGCGACPNGAPFTYYTDFGTWSLYPVLGGYQTADYDSGCTWIGPNITISNGSVTGTYHWVHTEAGDNSSWELWFVSGTDIFYNP